MKKTILLTILLYIICTPTKAQSELSFGNILSINGDTVEVEIVLNNKSGLALGGFQFDLENGQVDTAYGGDIAAFGWEHQVYFNPNLTATSSRVLCFNFGSANIPADSSVLMILKFKTINILNDICLTGVIISDQGGSAIPTTSGPCISINNSSVTKNTFTELLSYFPNPTNENISIDLGESREDIKIILRNMCGQVLSIDHYFSTNLINYKIMEPYGFYLIEIYGDVGEKASFKIIKQ